MITVPIWLFVILVIMSFFLATMIIMFIISCGIQHREEMAYLKDLEEMNDD